MTPNELRKLRKRPPSFMDVLDCMYAFARGRCSLREEMCWATVEEANARVNKAEQEAVALRDELRCIAEACHCAVVDPVSHDSVSGAANSVAEAVIDAYTRLETSYKRLSETLYAAANSLRMASLASRDGGMESSDFSVSYTQFDPCGVGLTAHAPKWRKIGEGQ